MRTDDLNAHLDRVLIGGREWRPIVLVGYDPAWPDRFQRERARIRDALGGIATSVEHVGSTSVPGLAAKPIIDVLVTVVDADDESAFVPALGRAGYRRPCARVGRARRGGRPLPGVPRAPASLRRGPEGGRAPQARARRGASGKT